VSSPITVDVDIRVDLPTALENPEEFIYRVLSAAGDHMKIGGEISVSLVSDEEIHALNRDFRQVDRPTDVLSFSLLEGEDDGMKKIPIQQMLGDVVVSIPMTIRQAEDYGHSPQRELGFLLVHGFLHLIGYDHQDVKEEARMMGLQEEILSQLKLNRTRDFSEHA